MSLFIGILSEAISIATLVMNYPNIITGRINLFGYTWLLFVGLGIIAGAYTLVRPFVTKIIVSPKGLEYHTLSCVIKSEWHQIMSIGNMSYDQAGSAIALVPLNPHIVAKEWTKYVPWWDVERNAIAHGIPVSWFGGFMGHRLRSDMQKFAPHLIV
ncbi:MAG: hypothetical protein GY832_04280 [Chloroflexi bacterium]|nr:hypothetical protein [Chloroflexota bacterium]